VLTSLKASIEDKHPEGDDADPTTAPFRHTLLIDRSNCESAIDLLFSMNVLDANETRVLTMPSNDIDQNSVDISEALRHVKNAAENGLTMLLVNGDALYSALYDLLNKYYNSGGGKEYFCNINLGAVSSPVSVHSKFKLIVYISADKVQTAPLPFLNRFSKFALSFHDALQDRVEFYKQPDNKPPCFYSEPPDNIELLFKGLVAGGEDFANYLQEIANLVHGTALIEVERKEAPAKINSGEQKSVGDKTYNCRYVVGARVHYRMTRGEQTFNGWIGIQSWIKMA
jgi:hypothetical protein